MKVDPNIFWDSVVATIWWRKVGYMEAHHLFQTCEYALRHKERFYIQGAGEQIDLTSIYEQCMTVELLKKDYHDQK
jgi:hypothetical protein